MVIGGCRLSVVVYSFVETKELDVLMCGIDGFRLGIDVTFIYGESDSYLPKNGSDLSADQMAVKARDGLMKECAARRKKKIKTYQSVCESRGIEFCAFVLESHGFMDESADDVL